MKFDFKTILILAAIVAGIIVWWSWPPEPDYSDYIKIGSTEYKILSSKVDTVWRDTTIIKEKRVPVPTYVEVPVEIPAKIDTAAILVDYYAKRFYNDTIVNIDGEGSRAIIQDTISRNRILSRVTQFDIKNKTIKETTIVLEPPRMKAFVGGGVTLGNKGVGANGGILLKNRQDNILGLRAGVINVPGSDELTPYVGAEYYIKLSFRKKNKR